MTTPRDAGPDPDNVVAAVTVFAVVAFVALTIAAASIYNSATQGALQENCMTAGGSWETREGSHEIGCRFPAKEAKK